MLVKIRTLKIEWFSKNRTSKKKFLIKKTVEVSFERDDTEELVVRKFVAPVNKFALHWDKEKSKQRPVSSIDVTDGGLGVSCSLDGSLLIWLTENGQIRVRSVVNAFHTYIYIYVCLCPDDVETYRKPIKKYDVREFWTDILVTSIFASSSRPVWLYLAVLVIWKWKSGRPKTALRQ